MVNATELLQREKMRENVLVEKSLLEWKKWGDI